MRAGVGLALGVSQYRREDHLGAFRAEEVAAYPGLGAYSRAAAFEQTAPHTTGPWLVLECTSLARRSTTSYCS